MGVRRRSPIQRARRATLAEREAAQPRTETRDLEDAVQTLKLIDIKRRSIEETSRRIPWAIAGCAIAAIPFGASLLLGSPIGLFVFGGLWAGATAQLVGPIGAFTLRAKARAQIPQLVEKLQAQIGALDCSSVFVFGVMKSPKGKIITNSPVLKLDGHSLPRIDDDGHFPFAPYRFLGIAFQREPTRPIQYEDDGIRHLDWVMYARSNGAQDAALNEVLATA